MWKSSTGRQVFGANKKASISSPGDLFDNTCILFKDSTDFILSCDNDIDDDVDIVTINTSLQTVLANLAFLELNRKIMKLITYKTQIEREV
jgi:hypothetical protein